MFNPDTVGWTIGVLFCALVCAQLIIHFMSATTQWVAQRRALDLQLETLRAELDIVRHRRRTVPRADRSWHGFRRFVVRALIRESDNAVSLYLVPQDRSPLPAFFPGQFVTVRCKLPDGRTRLVRSYSLSDRPREEFFRCTVKDLSVDARIDDSSNRAIYDAETALVSRYLNRSIREGDVLELQAPAGVFVMDLFERRPAVLLAAGIGITPLVSMMKAVCHEQTQRELVLFYGVRHGGEHVFAKEIDHLQSEHANVRVVTCYSRPRPEDKAGEDFDVTGRITLDLLKKNLPGNDYEYFLCGPDGFMNQMRDDLSAWGVQPESIRWERFIPASRGDTAEQIAISGGGKDSAKQSSSQIIRFGDGGVEIVWSDEYESILEAAEAQGVELPFSCRQGNCGTCLMRVRHGDVTYPEPPAFAVADDECLTCLGRPKHDDLHLDG